MPSGKAGAVQTARTALLVIDPVNDFLSEPGVFVINADGLLQVVDISNAPFARPDLAGLALGQKFIRDNDYPIRGRMAA